MKRIILTILIIIFICFFILIIYVNNKYKNINSEIRLVGFVADLFVNFDDVDSLMKLSNNRINIPYEMNGDIILEEEYIDTENGKIKVYIMKSKKSSDDEVGLLWLHGGGLAMKSPEDEFFLMEKFVLENNSVVISPEYTLSVEEIFPRAINDCYNTLVWMKDNAEYLGINDNQIFVGGGSAGGGLAASLALMARDKEEVNIAYLMALYPMINHYNISDEDDSFIWDKHKNKIAWELYLGSGYDPSKVSKYAAALVEDDFSDLPPTYSFVGDQDPFYEDTLEYVNKLSRDGNLVNLDVYEGAYHAFDITCSFCDISIEAWDKLMDEYNYASEHYYVEQKIEN